MSEFKELVSEELKDKIEFVSLNPSLFDGARGKGYNEALMIDLACNQSKLLSKGNPFVFKVTGRYSILNVSTFMRDCQKRLPNLDLFCDVKDHGLYRLLGHKRYQTCDTRHIAFRVSFWRKYVYGRYVELDDRILKTIEDLFFKLSQQLRHDPRCAFRFSSEILMRGFNGSRVHLFNVDIPRRIQPIYFRMRFVIGFIYRKLLPRFWI